MTETMAISFANVVMARWDALLRYTTLPPEARTLLRSAPSSHDSLFGFTLRTCIKGQADAQRDTAIAFLPPMMSQMDVSRNLAYGKHFSFGLDPAWECQERRKFSAGNGPTFA